MLYELVTGRPPFLGDDAVAVIWQHLNTPPVAPTWHSPAVPPALEALILALAGEGPRRQRRRAPAQCTTSSTRSAPRSRAETAATAPSHGERRSQPARPPRRGRLRRPRAEIEATPRGVRRRALGARPPRDARRRARHRQDAHCERAGDVRAAARRAGARGDAATRAEGAPRLLALGAGRARLRRRREPDSCARELGAGAADIAQVVPEVASWLPGLPVPPVARARAGAVPSLRRDHRVPQERRAAPAVCSCSTTCTGPTRRRCCCSQFLARELSGARLLVVGHLSRRRGRPPPPARGDAGGAGATSRSRADPVAGPRRGRTSARFIEMTAGRAAARASRRCGVRGDGGQSVLRHRGGAAARRRGRLDTSRTERWSVTIPQGVREVIGRRLERLDDVTNDVLTVAAVCGRTFALDSLVEAAGRDEPEVLAALDQAIGARLITEVTGAVPRLHLRPCTHPETIYDELTLNRRIRLHRRIALALEPRTNPHDQAAVAEPRAPLPRWRLPAVTSTAPSRMPSRRLGSLTRRSPTKKQPASTPLRRRPSRWSSPSTRRAAPN